ncbi:Der GTPase-activating protein YihI [Psychrobium sp. 1_MG-2023]|uniref:Der GTPase-activating protein YihI n=1 Tax=Psychrobium sp. 1_MG-2023 TaxID=3062624 RepID=UPI000C3450DB|nr:Der GTPase-activating protein YihI [Psychrobium sp. 1_MG-2023]MDP2561031.1 Der GTPase-activating protein YihI [Psychrobium sp. 1_MG-2023]PKF58324.1 hypothetical protein CW748_03960 [Alteromonadales bacterium alter-6D02]
MTRKKKTRTEKSIGAAKKPLLKQAERMKPNTKKKGKGRPSGAKANIDGAAKNSKRTHTKSNEPADNRVGSKKAIALVVEQPSKQLQPRASVKKHQPQSQLSLTQQLEKLENDERLNRLLDLLDTDAEISAKDQAYLEHQTARHQKLLIELGIVADEDEDEAADDHEALEPWEQLDSSEFDGFKD